MTVMLFAFATTALAGDFKIQSPVGTNIFTIDTSGNVNASGTIRESNVLLSDTYWAIADVAAPSDGDTTHLSTADQIYDWVIGLGYTAGWDTLDDMVLTDAYIYVGNATNDPHGVAVSGDITLSNAGVVAVIDTAGLSASNITAGTFADARLAAAITRDTEVPAWGYWNESSDLDDDELAEAKINFDTVCAAGNHLYVNGDDLACEADDDTTYTANTPLNLTGTVFDLIQCADTEIYKYNATAGDWECEADGGGMDDLIDDTTPQLGGNLDVNDFGIDGGGNTNMTIDATGNFIIVLS